MYWLKFIRPAGMQDHKIPVSPDFGKCSRKESLTLAQQREYLPPPHALPLLGGPESGLDTALWTDGMSVPVSLARRWLPALRPQNNHLGQGIEWAQRDPQPQVDSDSLPSQGPFGGLSIITPLPPSLGWGGGGFRGHENTTCHSDWLWASWGRMCFSWPGSLILSLVLSPPTWGP